MATLKHYVSIAILMVVIALMVGCANNPLGISDDEWVLLSPEQQFEAHKLQDERDEVARVRRAQQQAEEAAAQAELINLRRNAPMGDVVQCSITQAKGYFAKGEWFGVQPVSVEMHRSESDRKVSLVREDKPNSNIDVQLGFDGLNVKVCRSYDRDCNVLAGTEAQFARGITRRINIDRTVEGVLFCSFPLRR